MALTIPNENNLRLGRNFISIVFIWMIVLYFGSQYFFKIFSTTLILLGAILTPIAISIAFEIFKK